MCVRFSGRNAYANSVKDTEGSSSKKFKKVSNLFPNVTIRGAEKEEDEFVVDARVAEREETWSRIILQVSRAVSSHL
jgi:hypothetical protein